MMEDVAWEIVQNAVSACSRDPRFPPVTVSELDSLERFEVVRHL